MEGEGACVFAIVCIMGLLPGNQFYLSCSGDCHELDLLYLWT